MILKRVTITVIIIGLFGLTGAKVGALWPQQQVETVVSQPVLPFLTNKTVATNQIQIDPRTQVLLDRLNSRLRRNPDDFEASLLKGLLTFIPDQFLKGL